MAHYVTNKELLAELAVSRQLGRVSGGLAQLFLKMCHRYATKPNFAGYSYLEDMRSQALVNLLGNALKFDEHKYPDKAPNPFAYYTTCIHNSFLQYMNTERLQRDIRDEILISEGGSPSWSYEGDEGGRTGSSEKRPLEPGSGVSTLSDSDLS